MDGPRHRLRQLRDLRPLPFLEGGPHQSRAPGCQCVSCLTREASESAKMFVAVIPHAAASPGVPSTNTSGSKNFKYPSVGCGPVKRSFASDFHRAGRVDRPGGSSRWIHTDRPFRSVLMKADERSDRTPHRNRPVNHNALAKQRVREFHHQIPGTRSEP